MLSSISNWVTRTIADHGLLAVFGLMLLESACIPVPSEVIMLYAGYLVSVGKLSLVGAVAAGVAGNLVGSLIAWWVGSAGGRELILRYGRYVHVTESRLALADRWFERYGERTVLISRCLPVIRTFISLPAGIARMPLGASRSTPRSAACPGCSRSRCSATPSARTGRRCTRASRSSTTSSSWSCVAGLIWLTVRMRRSAGSSGAS